MVSTAGNTGAGNTGDRPVVPDDAEVMAALRAGYRAIDDGDGFYPGFDGWLESLGYQRRDDLPCTCPDTGDHGHLPECRWVRI